MSDVNVINPQGQLVSIPGEQVQDALGQGYKQATPKDIEHHELGSVGHQVLAGAEGALNTATFGGYQTASKLADKALGMDENFSNKVREANPNSYLAGQVAGLVSGAGAVKGAAKVAGAAAGLVESRLAGAAIRGAVDTAIFQGGDELSKMMQNDPHQSVQTAIANVGLAGLLGSVGGVSTHGLAEALGAVKASKAGQFLGDFKSRIGEHLSPSEVPSQVFNSDYFKVGSPKDAPMFVDSSVAAPVMSEAVTAGQKAADLFVQKGLAKISGEALATGLGAAAGSTVGHPYIGAAIGRKMFGDVFDSVIHTVIKPMFQQGINTEAFQAALKYAADIAKGETLLNNAAKSVFKTGLAVAAVEGNEKSRNKLDSLVDQSQKDPMSLVNVASQLGHYMPDHAAAAGQVTAQALQFLASVKPKDAKQSVLDSQPVVGKIDKAAYNQALDIANNPLSIINRVKDGSITAKDTVAMHTLFPQLHQKLTQKLTEHMIDHLGKGNAIPYKTAMGLSMYLNEPLVSSIRPYNLQMNQQATLPQAQQQGTQPQGNKRNIEAIGKLPLSYSTPQQTRQLNKSSRIK